MAGRPTRSAADTRASVSRLALPTDANFMGHVFGGVILAEIDRVAYVSATRHCGRTCVTASFDRVDFIAPVFLGEVVQFDAELTFAGRSSMEVWVRVHAEPLEGGAPRLVGEAFVTMVAVDRSGRPTEVPALVPSNEAEGRRFEEGRRRMEERRRTRATRAGGPGPTPQGTDR